jgi:hypothetical protein
MGIIETGTVGRIVQPGARGDWGRDYVVISVGNNNQGEAVVRLESVERLVTRRHAQESDLAPQEKHLAGVVTIDETTDRAAEKTTVPLAWFVPSPAAAPTS